MGFCMLPKINVIVLTFENLELARGKFMHRRNNIQQHLIQSFLITCKVNQILGDYKFVNMLSLKL